MERIEKHDPEYGRVLACMLLGSVVTFAVLYAPQPLLAVFSKEYGVSPATASASISLPALALAISLLFVPTLSRRIGRKRTMALSLFATSVLAIVSGFGVGQRGDPSNMSSLRPADEPRLRQGARSIALR